ncbi:MAG TPA: sulfur oxidation c-type cytochrome SoxX [Methylococcales bacterium]|nr:sulfur oxidation c-type cytochrome SoxX [Methylococcales bacterium]
MKTIGLLLALLIIGCTPPLNLEPQMNGQQLAFERKKGNCLACHRIANGESPGNIGPPLTHLSTRFTDKEALVTFIKDPTLFNPETSMPPFGKNNILSRQEIQMIANFLWTLPATQTIIP